MLIDCVKREFKDQNEKIVWILILALTNWIGAVIYYFLVKRKADAEGRSAPTQDKPKAKKQEST
ncbi:MAG: PLD nuclease N-terminal domain-containing protein [Candidatus Altiarchaeota archaeon]|nr:PLD nuclease N-terminal domain-containing protein [Candidatus Altiarchaeota archaeon]